MMDTNPENEKGLSATNAQALSNSSTRASILPLGKNVGKQESVNEAAIRYVQLGWYLTPFDRTEKGPNWKGWNRIENCVHDAAGAANCFSNIGICHLYSGTCCIDLDDLTKAVETFDGRGIDLMGYYNAADAVRISRGHANRSKLLFRLPPGVESLRTRLFMKWGFELRCASAKGLSVQDVLPPSTHPDTGNLYRWEGAGDPANLPYLPADIFEWWLELTAKSERGEVMAMGVGLPEIEALLARIDPTGRPYDEWLNVGMALHHETRGGDDGLALWQQWSSRAKDKFEEDAQEPKWPSFHLDHPNPRTIATLSQMADEADMESEFGPVPDLETATTAARAEELPTAASEPETPAAAPVTKHELPEHRAVAFDVMRKEPSPPRLVVDEQMLVDAQGFVAPGGTGKTTLSVYEGVHIILGKPLWGRRVIKPGAFVLVTAEDSREVIESILVQVCRALNLTEVEQRTVAANFFIEDMSTTTTRLVNIHPKTGMPMPTVLVDKLIRAYERDGVSLVHVDPVSLLGPGEQSGNDGMGVFMHTLRAISRGVGGCAQGCHHVAQAVARGGIQDQYAGRGGTAFADNSRGQRQLVRIRDRAYEFNNARYHIPENIPDEQLLKGRVLALLVHKLSYVEVNPTPTFVNRVGYAFVQFEAEHIAKKPAGDAATDTATIAGFIERELANGRYHSPNSVSMKAKALGLSERRIDRLIKEALLEGTFEEANTPKTPGKKGGRSRHLVVIDPDDL